MSLLSFLFPSSDESKDWNQSQTEALIDLLYLAIYADNHLSQTEESAISKEIDAIGWESETSIDAYKDKAVTRARNARNNGDFKNDYLKDIGARFHKESAKSKALEICGKVLNSDGLHETELNLLDEIRATWS